MTIKELERTVAMNNVLDVYVQDMVVRALELLGDVIPEVPLAAEYYDQRVNNDTNTHMKRLKEYVARFNQLFQRDKHDQHT